ncbi:MAG: hypothetical protein AB1478_03700 [Nitrospirota bacterium]
MGVCIARIGNLIIEKSVYKMADITGLSKEVIPLIENVWKVIIIVAGFMVILLYPPPKLIPPIVLNFS